MRKTLTSLVLVMLICGISNANSGDKTLRYREDGTFKIVQFADIHWQNGDVNDIKTSKLMEEILDVEKPDLVVMTGDNIAGGGCNDCKKAILGYSKPMVDRKIPWAVTFGNHDDEGPMNRKDQMKQFQTVPFCLAKAGPEDIDGVSNYYLNIYDSKGDKAKNTLYFIDSLSYAPKEIGGYAWITRKQINWYVETAAKIEKENGRKLPALAFFHIPIPEYDQVFDANSLGSKNEVVCCSKINSGFFAAMLEAGDIMGTFVGHDHTSDYEGTLNGIRLCYGRGIGYSTYGKDGFPRGAKVIVLTEDKKDFQTWVRAEGGQKIDYQKEKQAACQSDK